MTVMTPGVLAAESIADALLAALEDRAVLPVAERLMARYLQAQDRVSVPLKEAAEELEVSLPTIRNWVAQGLLSEVGNGPRAISVPSLALVLAARRSAGLRDDEPRPAAKILEELRDRSLLERAFRVAASSSSRDFAQMSEEDLDQLLTL